MSLFGNLGEDLLLNFQTACLEVWLFGNSELFGGQTSNIADDDDEDDTKVTYRSSLPELKKV